MDRIKGPINTTIMRVKWDPPNQPVEVYRILYRKFEWVYTGKWKMKELYDPNALSTEIVVEPIYSYIVVVRGIPKRQNLNFPMMGQMNHVETIVPPNVTVDRVKGTKNSTIMRVKWDPPNQPVEGYRILYRKFEWVYTGRWKLKELNDPNALSTEIVVDDPKYSNIVVVRGTAKRQNPNFPMMGQMDQQMMGGGRMSQGNQQMSGSVMMSPLENGRMNPMMGGGMNPMANIMNQTIN